MSHSKEGSVMELFFNSPRHWHFEEIIEKAAISRPQLGNWLRLLLKDEIIRKVKEKGKMPYYIGNFESPGYKVRKKLFALERFYSAGFLSHLAACDADAIIIFGSFARADWYENSDIDLFVYGKAENLDLATYELKLKKEIQLFHFKRKVDIKKIDKGLLQNIARGYIIKGNLDFVNISLKKGDFVA